MSTLTLRILLLTVDINHTISQCFDWHIDCMRLATGITEDQCCTWLTLVDINTDDLLLDTVSCTAPISVKQQCILTRPEAADIKWIAQHLPAVEVVLTKQHVCTLDPLMCQLFVGFHDLSIFPNIGEMSTTQKQLLIAVANIMQQSSNRLPLLFTLDSNNNPISVMLPNQLKWLIICSHCVITKWTNLSAHHSQVIINRFLLILTNCNCLEHVLASNKIDHWLFAKKVVYNEFTPHYNIALGVLPYWLLLLHYNNHFYPNGILL